jgi:hypothetical protein
LHVDDGSETQRTLRHADPALTVAIDPHFEAEDLRDAFGKIETTSGANEMRLARA